jgi:prophage DNA circulation protein
MALAQASISEQRIVEQLQELTWRGRRAPCFAAPFKFSHSQSRRAYPYVNGAAHDWTGLDAIPMTVQLYFLNTIEPGSFPGEYSFWQENLFDGAPGPLVHPVLGAMDAVVMDGSVELTAQNKAGVIVSVTFEKTIVNLEQDQAFQRLTVNAEAVAAACDADLASLGVPIPDVVPEVASLLESYNGIKGELFSASLSIEGAINQLSAVVTDLVATLDDMNDPLTWPAQANLVLFWNTLRELAEQSEKAAARPTAKKKVQNDTTLDAIASETGNTIDDIISLNLNLLISPTVPKGAVVRYYR